MSFTECISPWVVSPKGHSVDLYASHNLVEISTMRPALLIGGVHGDEPEGVRLATDLLTFLKPLVNPSCPWIVIPCLNPDGVVMNERTNGRGVDLNRNFPARNWTADFSKPRYYPGTKPSSEPEVSALVSLIHQVQPRWIIHFHSWHPCIVYAGPPVESIARLLAQSSGYELKEDIGYPTPGSLSDFAWLGYQIPVICVEEQEHMPLDLVWPHFAPAFAQIFKESSR